MNKELVFVEVTENNLYFVLTSNDNRLFWREVSISDYLKYWNNQLNVMDRPHYQEFCMDVNNNKIGRYNFGRFKNLEEAVLSYKLILT